MSLLSMNQPMSIVYADMKLYAEVSLVPLSTLLYPGIILPCMVLCG